jgi:hypothetical protein
MAAGRKRPNLQTSAARRHSLNRKVSASGTVVIILDHSAVPTDPFVDGGTAARPVVLR